MDMDNMTCTRNVNQKQQEHEKPKHGYKTAKTSPYTSKKKMWKSVEILAMKTFIYQNPQIVYKNCLVLKYMIKNWLSH